MSKSLPWLKAKMSPFMNIESLDKEDIPEEPGVYIMMSDHTEYLYPWSDSKGPSQVYYIGQSKNLRDRLNTHKRLYLRSSSTKYLPPIYWEPRYEYASHHGCNVAWMISKTPRKTEHALLVDFARYYGAKPVADGQSAWSQLPNRLRRIGKK
jgi:hypothetical protein